MASTAHASETLEFVRSPDRTPMDAAPALFTTEVLTFLKGD